MASVKRPKRVRDLTYIKAWREFRRLTQEQASLRLGISRENYGRIESGKVPYNQDFLEQAAVAFNCTKSDLLERDPRIDDMIDKLHGLIRTASPEERKQLYKVAKSLFDNNG